MKKIYSLLLSIMCCISYSQISTIQDANGETSYQSANTTIAFNVKNSEASLNIAPKKVTNQDITWSSFTTSFKVKDDISKIFEGGKIQYDGKLGYVQTINLSTKIGKDNPPGKKYIIQSVYIGGEAAFTSLRLYDSTKVFKDQLYNEQVGGFKVYLGYNNKHSFLGKSTLGFAVSGGLKNNSDNLDISKIITSDYTETSSTLRTRMVTTIEDAYIRQEFKKSLKFSVVNLDLGHHFLSQRLFVNLHSSYHFLEEVKPVVNTSLGFFLMKNGAPMEAIVGLQLQLNDLGNTMNSEKSPWERSIVALTAGFPFN